MIRRLTSNRHRHQSSDQIDGKLSFEVEPLESRQMLAGDSFDWSSFNEAELSGLESDELVREVVIDGDTMVLGSPYVNNAAGEAIVYTRTNGTWNRSATFTGSQATQHERFGWDVDIDDDTIVVGSNYDNNADGAAYVFQRIGSNWTEQAVLRASDAANSDEFLNNHQFGYSVAVEDNTIVVGAERKNNTDGGIYIFDRVGTNWTESFKADAGGSWLLGQSVEISDGIVMAGAGGKASLFLYASTSQGNWFEVTEIDAPTRGFDMDDGVLVIGAPRDFTDEKGEAYVYEQDASGAWNLVDTLVSKRKSDGFGSEIRIQGDTIVIGAFVDDAGKFNSGALHVYQNSGNHNWKLEKTIKESPAVQSGLFGASFDLQDGTLVTRSQGDGHHVYVFDAAPGDETIDAQLVGGILTVTGTQGIDKIKVAQSSDSVSVKAAKFSATFDSAQVNRIDILAGDGNDSVTLASNVAIDARIYGENGNDKLKGGRGNDFLEGGLGNDTLTVKFGENVLYGLDGDDRISGGSERDVIFGGNGNDRIKGGNGDNQISGGSGNDIIAGGKNDDFITGGGGNDSIKGGAGHDILYGNDGDDKIIGGSGDDDLFGGLGIDKLIGGSGVNNLFDE